MMTTAEYLASQDPVPRLMKCWASNRKWKLYACAVTRQLWHMLDEKCRHAIYAAESFIERDGDASKLITCAAEAMHVCYCTSPGDYSKYQSALTSHWCCMVALLSDNVRSYIARTLPGIHDVDDRVKVKLLNDVIRQDGPPITYPFGTRTSLVRSLALTAYTERLPGGKLNNTHLQAVANVLEETGYGDAKLIEYLRTPGPHYRGCWPVDLMLGKR